MTTRSIHLRFLEGEDRIAIDLLSDSEIATFLVTRRITRHLIARTADLLAQSNPLMPRTPVENRKDVMIFEHQAAMQAAAEAAAGPPADETENPRRLRNGLLKRVDMTVHPTHFAAMLTDEAGLAVTASLSRAELHRLLAGIHRLAQQAEWDLGRDCLWLHDAQAAPDLATTARC